MRFLYTIGSRGAEGEGRAIVEFVGDVGAWREFQLVCIGLNQAHAIDWAEC